MYRCRKLQRVVRSPSGRDGHDQGRSTLWGADGCSNAAVKARERILGYTGYKVLVANSGKPTPREHPAVETLITFDLPGISERVKARKPRPALRSSFPKWRGTCELTAYGFISGETQEYLSGGESFEGWNPRSAADLK
jgi:hypothetical protein